MRKKDDNEFLSKKTITKVKNDDLVKQDRKKEHSLPMPTESSELNYKVENLKALVSQSIDKEFEKLKEIFRQAISLHQPAFDQINTQLEILRKTLLPTLKRSNVIDDIKERQSIVAIDEHFKRLLLDERLIAVPHNRQVIDELHKQLIGNGNNPLGNAVSSIKAKNVAKRGGAEKVKKYGYAEQKEACRSYYLEHKSEYKNKADAAYAIEGKTINNVGISVSPRTIEKYLTGL